MDYVLSAVQPVGRPVRFSYREKEGRVGSGGGGY